MDGDKPRERVFPPSAGNFPRVISEGVERDTANEAMSGLPVRVQRLGDARGRAVQMIHWLNNVRKSGRCERREAADKLAHCADYLGFRHYLEPDAVKLHTASFCKQHLICPVCAIRRGSKAVQRYVERFEVITADEAHGLRPWMLTYTVKNGDDLAERMAHLRRSMAKLIKARRQERLGSRGYSSTWRNMAGAVGSIEVTNKGKGWHPHVHIFGMFEGEYAVSGMSEEWKRITGDSHVCEAHPVWGEPAEAFCEVFKYALKFSEMGHKRTWQAAQILKGQRLLFSLGCFRGVVIPENLLDDPLDGPWVEYFYRYIGSGRYGLSTRY